MEEKRRLRRRYLLAEVKVRPQTDDDWTDAVLMNINRGGMCLYALGSIRNKSRVVIKIIYSEGRKKLISEEIPGVVKWVVPVGGQRAAGVMFTEKVSRANFPVLSKCLAYAVKNK